MSQVTGDTVHVTCDTWNVTHFKDFDERALNTQFINEQQRCMLKAPGLLHIVRLFGTLVGNFWLKVGWFTKSKLFFSQKKREEVMYRGDYRRSARPTLCPSLVCLLCKLDSGLSTRQIVLCSTLHTPPSTLPSKHDIIYTLQNHL